MSDVEAKSEWGKSRVLELSSWHHDWQGLKVAVLGLGVTGFSVADTLAELGARVRVIAAKSDDQLEDLLKVIGAELCLAPDDESQLAILTEFGPDLVVVSPGYRPDHPLTTWATEQDIPVWGDIELGWRLRDKTDRVADWICITGTNGKTTTAQMTAHMLVAGGLRAAPVGNIGVPILDALRDPQGFDVLVVELSSFQLERLGNISPYASVCLNIADDHIDWHGGRSEYEAAKAKVYEHTQVACVYNRNDSVTEKMVEDADVIEGARAVSFGLDTPPVSGLGVIEGLLVDRGFHTERRDSALEIMSLSELSEVGLAAPHLVQDLLAAAALARSRGIKPEDIAAAMKGFAPDEHRMQVVAKKDEITWVDDSKATNAHAAAASLQSFKKVVWIAGGLLKGQDLTELVVNHVKRLRSVIVIGEDRSNLVSALSKFAKDVPVFEIEAANGDSVMTKAVAKANEAAVANDIVLLSPATASFDQFDSYQDRGNKFKQAVLDLTGGAKALDDKESTA